MMDKEKEEVHETEKATNKILRFLLFVHATTRISTFVRIIYDSYSYTKYESIIDKKKH